MISRCPSCGSPAPDEARQCPGCGWDFITNKRDAKKAETAKEPEPASPASSTPAPVEAPAPEPLAAEAETTTPPPEVFLPSSKREIVVEAEAKPAETPAQRKPVVYFSAAAGGILGLLCVAATIMMLRSEPQGAARPAASSPFGKRSSGGAALSPTRIEPAASMPAAVPPPPSPPPASPDDARPTATFAQRPQPRPAAPPAVVPKISTETRWVFEGTVFDLLTTRGVYGARLVFINAKDEEVAFTETGEGGRYRASMPSGPAGGYALRIEHDDYSGKHVDELDATGSVRKADLVQRKLLMQAGARGLPWIGDALKPVRRDVALVPKTFQE